MGKMRDWLDTRPGLEDGQALVEYSLILILCSIVSVAALGLLGANLAALYSKIETSIASVL